MTFKPGQSGNPAGRAVGSRNKKTLAAEALLFEHAQELVANLVTRAKRGEPAAMRLAMERIVPAGRGRPLPIELPPVRSTEDAQVAAGVIMDALKEGALSAREAVDLINVVGALTRLTGTIEYIKKVVRREVARSAQTLGFEHFFAGRPADNNYARQVEEMNADEEAAAETETETDEDELPRNPNAWPPSEDGRYWRNRADMGGVSRRRGCLAGTRERGDDGLQIVADSDDGGRRTEVG
jgi:Family of unknown function (DUF5681)